jgi:hypothetical protein
VGEDTTFIARAKSVGAGMATKRTVIAGGTGLSTAAIIWIYATFASKGDLERHRQSQTTQWQQISALRVEINDLKTRIHAYEKLLDYVTTGIIRANVSTNGH